MKNGSILRRKTVLKDSSGTAAISPAIQTDVFFPDICHKANATSELGCSRLRIAALLYERTR
jgi:hypothetical protein